MCTVWTYSDSQIPIPFWPTQNPVTPFPTSTLLSHYRIAQIFPSTLCSQTPSFPQHQNDQFSHPYKITVKVKVLRILIFTILDTKPEHKIFWTEWQQALTCSNHLFISSLKKINLLKLFPNIWNLPPFQRSYCQSPYCHFALHLPPWCGWWYVWVCSVGRGFDPT
jgi:hypothetical protein